LVDIRDRFIDIFPVRQGKVKIWDSEILERSEKVKEGERKNECAC
jgi:hypothetical protein